MALLAFALIALVVVKHGTDKTQGGRFLEAVFPVFRGMILLGLHVYFYGANMSMWKAVRINYPFIFGVKPGTELLPAQVLALGSVALLCITTGALAHVSAEVAMTIWPALRSVFNPDIIPFVLSLVVLPDFFLADQLTSQCTMLMDMAYTLFYFCGGFWKERQDQPMLSQPVIAFIIFSLSWLPFYWRMMQCLRRYWDEGVPQIHLANAGKYFTLVVMVWMRAIKDRWPTQTTFILWAVICFLGSIVTIGWDLVLDWGMLDRNSKNPWLRDELIIQWKPLYWICMCLNVVARLTWIRFGVGSWGVRRIPQQVSVFLWALVELLRRIQWNFFRLENEHLNNCGMFRALRTIPLPLENTDDLHQD